MTHVPQKGDIKRDPESCSDSEIVLWEYIDGRKVSATHYYDGTRWVRLTQIGEDCCD